MMEVRIFGAPTACATGISDSWRRMTDWLRGQLTARYGDMVNVHYYDVLSREAEEFSDAMNLISQGHPLPLVFVGSELVFSGGKIVVAKIVSRLDALGLQPTRVSDS